MPWTYYLTDDQRASLHEAAASLKAALDAIETPEGRKAAKLTDLTTPARDLIAVIEDGLYGTETPEDPALTPSPVD